MKKCLEKYEECFMKITLIDDICDFTLIECLKFYIVGMRAIINDGQIIGFESEDE